MPIPAFHRAAQVLLYMSQDPRPAWLPGPLSRCIHAPAAHVRAVLMALAVAGILDGNALVGYRLSQRRPLTLAAILQAVRAVDRHHCPAADDTRRHILDLAAQHFDGVSLPPLHSPHS